MAQKILVIDDETDIREVLADIFEDEGYHVLKAAHSEQAFNIIEKDKPDLIVLDIWLENSDLDGIGILKALKKQSCPHNAIPVLMISGHGNIEMAVKAMKIGAYDFIEKPFKIDHILLTVERALEQVLLKQENSNLKHKINAPTLDYKTKSPKLMTLLKSIQEDKLSEARVLIEGDIGTGKSRLARYIHHISTRHSRPLYTFQARSVDEETVNHWFTGKDYESATILIEQVEDMPKNAQALFLKFLGQQTKPNLPRFVSTTSYKLKGMIEKSDFSSALYDRIAVLKYKLPSLADRIEDFPDMIASFASHICRPMEKPTPTFSSEAILFLQNYNWVGNITQLKCLVELVALNYALNDTSGNPITANAISAPLSAYEQQSTPTQDDHATVEMSALPSTNNEMMGWLDLPLRDSRENFERFYLSHLIHRFRGNISQMASHIDMERTALHRKLKSMDIRYDEPQITARDRKAG